jgi:integrase
VKEVIDLYIERYCRPKNRRWRDVETALKGEVDEAWGHRGIATITQKDVRVLLDKIVERGKPVMANRTHGMIRKFFNWCIDRGLLEQSPVSRLKAPAHEVSRDRVLSDDELRRVWQGADKIGYPYGSLIKLLILTGQRRADARISERQDRLKQK